MAQEQIHVVIVDDHPLVRQGLEVILTTQRDMLLVGQASDGEEVVQVALEQRPDVVVLDIRMPKQDGLAAMLAIKQALPATRFLVLSSFADDELVLSAIKLGAAGFLLKESSHAELLNAIRAVARGESALHPTVARTLVQSYQARVPQPPAVDALSTAEVKVLQLLTMGLSNREIADELGVSLRTITSHVRNILDKLHVSNRTQAALYAREHGIVPLKKNGGSGGDRGLQG